MDINDTITRFDDELCEYLLSYLSVGDCLTYQCVCKQFQKVIFNRITELRLCLSTNKHFTQRLMSKRFGETVNRAVFEYVMMKCVKVEDIAIECEFDEQTIVSICEVCDHLRSIRFGGRVARTTRRAAVSDNTWIFLGVAFGATLESISFNSGVYTDNTPIRRLFGYTRNLIECKVNDLNDCIVDEHYKHILPKLKSITAGFSKQTHFNAFAQQFYEKIEKIDLTWISSDDEDNSLEKSEAIAMFEHLSRFEKLEALRIDFKLSAKLDDNSIESALNLVLKGCKKLLELELNGLRNNGQMRAKRVQIRQQNNSLEKFSISFSSKSIFIANLEYLSTFCNLRDLRITGNALDCNLLDAIHSNAPHLKRIALLCPTGRVTDHTLSGLAFLTDLIALSVETDVEFAEITDNGLNELISKCVHIRRIELWCVLNVSKATLHAFISRAVLNPTLIYKLIIKNVNCFNIENYEWKCMSNELPKNVTIDLIFPKEITFNCALL